MKGRNEMKMYSILKVSEVGCFVWSQHCAKQRESDRESTEEWRLGPRNTAGFFARVALSNQASCRRQRLLSPRLTRGFPERVGQESGRRCGVKLVFFFTFLFSSVCLFSAIAYRRSVSKGFLHCWTRSSPDSWRDVQFKKALLFWWLTFAGMFAKLQLCSHVIIIMKHLA